MSTGISSLPVLHRGRSLELRRTHPDDAAFLYRQMYCKAQFMRLFRLNDAVSSEADLQKRLSRRLDISPAESGYLELMIQHRRHGAIGVVAAADYSPLHRRAEFLIGLFDPIHYHCGYSIEASLMLGDLIFNQYNLHRFYAYSYSYNDLAHRTLCSGGFLPEGSMKEHVFDQASGRFFDLAIFGMTIDQFRSNRRLARLSLRLLGRDITQPPPRQDPPQPMKPPFQRSGARILRR